MSDTPKELTDSQKLLVQAIVEAIQNERERERKTSGRTIAQAIWHGITVAKTELWNAMGWPQK